MMAMNAINPGHRSGLQAVNKLRANPMGLETEDVPCPCDGMKRLLRSMVCLGLVSLSASAAPQSIVLLLTNVDFMMSDQLKPGVSEPAMRTGFYLSEAAHPYHVFKEAGYEVVFASPKGGFAPVDPKSLDLKDKENAKFWEAHGVTLQGRGGVKDTAKLSDLDPKDFAGIYAAGGHGACWDFPNNAEIAKFISAIYANGGVVGAVCHGPMALVGVKDADGKPLVAGRKLAVFTDAEEKEVKLDKIVPFLLQAEMEKAGARVVPTTNWAENAVRDGRLVTGQNPASATKSAKLFVEAMKAAE